MGEKWEGSVWICSAQKVPYWTDRGPHLTPLELFSFSSAHTFYKVKYKRENPKISHFLLLFTEEFIFPEKKAISNPYLLSGHRVFMLVPYGIPILFLIPSKRKPTKHQQTRDSPNISRKRLAYFYFSRPLAGLHKHAVLCPQIFWGEMGPDKIGFLGNWSPNHINSPVFIPTPLMENKYT